MYFANINVRGVPNYISLLEFFLVV